MYLYDIFGQFKMNIGSVLNEFVTTFHFITPNFPLLQTTLK